MGVHWAPGDNAEMLRLFHTQHDKGKPIPATLILGGPGCPPIAEVARCCPLVVNRHYFDPRIANVGQGYDGGYKHVAWYYHSFMGGDPDARAAHYQQVTNELDEGLAVQTWLPEWWQGAMESADALGFKITVCNFSVGYPGRPTEGKDGSWFWSDPRTHKMLRYARDHGHILNLHQYDLGLRDWSGTDDIMRHKTIYKVLPADLQTLPLIMSEFGQEKLPTLSPMAFLTKLKNAQRLLADDPQVKGVMLWTYNHTPKWEGDDWRGLLPTYASFAGQDILATVRAIVRTITNRLAKAA